jgi:hypothetical protein
VYLAAFAARLVLLPCAGPGADFLPQQLRAPLIGNAGAGCALWAARIRGPGLLYRTLWLSRDMHVGNMAICEFHDSMSFPAQWPLLRGVMTFFWAECGAEIRCLGNVFSYYCALVGGVAVAFGWRRPNFWNAAMFGVGWAVCYFPSFWFPA